MKLNAIGGVVVFLVFALSACGTGDGEPEPGLLTGNATTMVNQLPLEDCTEHGCPNGCVQIDYGVDDNANGSLDNPSEIDGTDYVCHGTNGENGAGGQDGAQGDAGTDGADGANGADGADGEDGAPGTDGEDGAPGEDGEDGADGDPGTTGSDGSGCTVSQADCQATLSCDDGTSVSWELPGCSCDQCGFCDDDSTNDDTSCLLGLIDNLNGTITDTVQGITWMKCAQGMTFNADTNTCEGSNATFQYCDEYDNSCNDGGNSGFLDGGGNSSLWDTCNNLEFANFTDWRVPNLEELSSLVLCNDGPLGYPSRFQCGSNNYTAPTIDRALFPDFPSTLFWTSASYGGDGPLSAFYVYFYQGFNNYDYKGHSKSALCVR